ncbi:MAG: MBOAT family protein [Bacteroidetes bacterium]|nr:MBOAT family protein [Bacteroidota bacterium]
MLFTSFAFLLFFPIVFILYWALGKTVKIQNGLLVIASLVFYGFWDLKFLLLLAFTIFIGYYGGKWIANAKSNFGRKTALFFSICISLAILGTFKYFNFFSQSLADFAAIFGWKMQPYLLKLILPVGISFYTFHNLSYVIDLYYRRIEPEKSFLNYSLFVGYFPLLVAGPIERATHLLPQLQQKREFVYSDAINGMRQILWGLFKKVVIADTCAFYSDMVFANPAQYPGWIVLFGLLLFTIEIYCDFSGYSDIALGISRLFGIELLRNFAFPYFSRNIAEFWRKWHISLTTWFRDYLYIPLGGSKSTKFKTIRNTIIIFLVSGFWHGANWTFIIWGALHACYFIPLLLLGRNRKYLDFPANNGNLPGVREAANMLLTFLLVMFAWIFFRAENVVSAFDFIRSLFQIKGIVPPWPFILLLSLIAFTFLVEWTGRKQAFALSRISLPGYGRWATYLVLGFVIYMNLGSEKEFIYFQF